GGGREGRPDHLRAQPAARAEAARAMGGTSDRTASGSLWGTRIRARTKALIAPACRSGGSHHGGHLALYAEDARRSCRGGGLSCSATPFAPGGTVARVQGGTARIRHLPPERVDRQERPRGSPESDG